MPKERHKVRALVGNLLAVLIAFASSACSWAPDSAGLVAELEVRYPGSRIEIEDTRESRAQRIEVKIIEPNLAEEADLAEHGREVADLVRRRYDLAGAADTVVVAFRSEKRSGPLAMRQTAEFVYSVSELGADE